MHFLAYFFNDLKMDINDVEYPKKLFGRRKQTLIV